LNRIEKVFSGGKKALAVYLTAGFPEPGADEELAMTILESGADILELGFPFSDPIADGPVIQDAAKISLKNGTSLKGTMDLASRLRRRTEAPIILMGYLNPVYHMGYPEFARLASESGVDGAIIPDLPLEQSSGLRDELSERDMALIPMAAPNTPPDRLKRILESGDGFLYLVSMTGLTGDVFNARAAWRQIAGLARDMSDLPVCVGFGIKTSDDAVRAVEVADGVIVGAAVISNILDASGPDEANEKVARLVGNLSAAIRQGQ
jgi:tryptophan synthase alpha chain